MRLFNILSLFGPKVLEVRESKYNSQVIVKRGWGYDYITTNNQSVTQSGGIVNEVWAPALKKISSPNKSWLILGLAGGTIAQTVSSKFSPREIVGVEIDPVMIDVAKKYFHIDKISKLQIVNANAQKYVKSQAIKFDYVLVDMYFGEKPPEFIYSKSFITDLKKISKTVVINHLFYDTWSKDNAQKLVEKLHLYFNNIELVRSLANLLIICQ